MHNLLDRCYGRGSAGRHLRRRSGERVELVDHVQREVGASGQQQERCDGTQTRTPSSNTYEDCEERAGVQDGHLLSEGKIDDGVREERGERAEKRRRHKYWEAVKKIKSGWNETKRVTHMT